MSVIVLIVETAGSVYSIVIVIVDNRAVFN